MEYKTWRRRDGDLNDVSLHTQLGTIRVFLRFLEDIEAVEQGLAETVAMPTLDTDDGVRDVVLEADHGERIDEYLDQYEYASEDHALWTILYGIGVRLGTAHSLDVSDFERREKRLWFRHRPDEGTTLKNGKQGERPVTLSAYQTRVLADYIDDVRIDATDDYGRRPLLSRPHGRVSKSTLRRTVYRLTQPCQIGLACPHGTTEQACPTAGYTSTPSGCPSIVSPHAIRKRTIIDYRKDEIPDQYISDRANVNQKTMYQHYDVKSPEELKMIGATALNNDTDHHVR